jgi:hypothetical protein
MMMSSANCGVMVMCGVIQLPAATNNNSNQRFFLFACYYYQTKCCVALLLVVEVRMTPEMAKEAASTPQMAKVAASSDTADCYGNSVVRHRGSLW